MAANNWTVEQVYPIMNAIARQATGNTELTAVDGSSFVTVGQTALGVGFDPLVNAVNQVLSRTIFSNRPYYRKFQGLEADAIRFGNHVRKINFSDTGGGFENNDYLPITAGTAVDQQIPVKPDVIQTNFIGQNTWSIKNTIYREQLLTAFQTPEQLGSFVTSQVQNITDRIEACHENVARNLICQAIGGVATIGNAHQIVHLLTEYNAYTGLELTAQTVYQPANYAAFMRWAYARIQTVSALMTERSQILHQNISEHPIQRHTPVDYQRLYIYAPMQYQAEANSLAITYHDDRVYTLPVTEMVNYWQSINTPESISVTPVTLQSDGTLKTDNENYTSDKIFGILMDTEFAGYTIVDNRTTAAPPNAAGEYQNYFYKFSERFWVDYTENSVIFAMD